MNALPGRLCFARHLRHNHPNTEIMLRFEAGKRGKPGVYVIYLDGEETARVAPKPEVVNGIPSHAHAAYRKCDEVAGYSLADDKGDDLEASLSR